MTPAARRPAMPSPKSPTQSTTATARPSQPAQLSRAPNADEEGGGDHLPDDVLERQLAGDPRQGEAEHGEGLPPDGAVGQHDGDGPDEGDDQEGVRHATIFARMAGVAAGPPWSERFSVCPDAAVGARLWTARRRPRRVDDPRTAERARCELPLHGDAHAPHARGHHGRLRPLDRARRLLVPADPPAHQRPHPAGARLPAPPGRGAHAPRATRSGSTTPSSTSTTTSGAPRCPSPGGMRELGDFAADVISRQLHRDRPLWEMWIVEGVEDGKIALVTKMHHSTIDGVSGAELLGVLFDLEPDPPATPTLHAAPARLAHPVRPRAGLAGHDGRPGGALRRGPHGAAHDAEHLRTSAASARA